MKDELSRGFDLALADGRVKGAAEDGKGVRALALCSRLAVRVMPSFARKAAKALSRGHASHSATPQVLLTVAPKDALPAKANSA